MPDLKVFFFVTLALSAPLLLAALGEIIGERAGVLNIGLEAMMLGGAWAAAAVGAASHRAGIGFLAALGAGILLAALFGLLVLNLRADAVVVGTGLNLFALGLTGTLHRIWAQKFGTYAAPRWPEWTFALLGAMLALVLTVVLFRTRAGLRLRAAGESPAALESAGVSVLATRWKATLLNGALCGAAGGFLVLGRVGTFGENMTAGQGFIALAIVIFGRWQPLGAVGAALLFGGAQALQISLQGSAFPKEWYPALLALPYVLCLVTLAGFAGKSRAPLALNNPDA